MIAFQTLYRPFTSRPYLRNSTYAEYQPCEELKPYIVCFWGTEGAGTAAGDREVLVVPDTCADIINHTRQKITGRLCGIQDVPFTAKQGAGGDVVSRFAVRFYFWAVRHFLDLNMGEMRNQMFDLETIQPGCSAGFDVLFRLKSMGERIAWMERYLMRLKNARSPQFSPSLYQGIHYILRSSGQASVKEICEYSCVSKRQMERLFQQVVGLSVKRTAKLVRYQNVWGDMVRQEEFRVQEAVYRYGYADQAHLLNEFKRFHGVTPEQAKKIAAANR